MPPRRFSYFAAAGSAAFAAGCDNRRGRGCGSRCSAGRCGRQHALAARRHFHRFAADQIDSSAAAQLFLSSARARTSTPSDAS